MTGPNLKRANLVSLALLVASLAIVAWFYPRLPDPFPTHWNVRGEADQFTPKPWGPFLVPLIQAGCWLLLVVVPTVSPNRFRMERFGAAYGSILLVLNGFFAALNGVAVAESLGHSVGMGRVMLFLVGGLTVGLGNYLGKTTPNFFVGVRTPWTLASPIVWERTHRLAAWLFVATGALMIIVGALTARAPFAVLLVLVPALVAAVYSFVIYRRLEGFGSGSDDAGEP